MIKLQVLPEEILTLQVLEGIVKSGQPVILPKQITANGVYSAKQEGASGYDPVTVAVDMTPAYNEGYDKGYVDGHICDFSKMRYVYLHDLNGFTKSDVVLNLGNHGVDEYLSFHYISYQANNTVERLTLNIGEGIQLLAWDGSCNSAPDKKLKHLTINAPNAKFTSGYGIFRHWQALEVIDGTPIDLSLDTRGAACEFVGLNALREVRFAPNSLRGNMWFGNSQYLSNDSAQSVIDGLMDLTGAATKTLTFHKDVGAKLTPEQKAVITAKNWTLVY